MAGPSDVWTMWLPQENPVTTNHARAAGSQLPGTAGVPLTMQLRLGMVQVCPAVGHAVAMGQGDGGRGGSRLCGDAPLGLSWCGRGLGKTLLWGHNHRHTGGAAVGFAAKTLPAQCPDQRARTMAGPNQALHGVTTTTALLMQQSRRQRGNSFPLEQTCGTGHAGAFGLPVLAAVSVTVLSTPEPGRCHRRSLCHLC